MNLKAVAASELAARVEAALATLPPRHRSVFLAIRDERVSYGVLAERLAISTDEVERAFAEALVALDRAAEHQRQVRPAGALLRRIGAALGLSRRRSGS